MVLKHVVFFKFKADVSSQRIADLEKHLSGLPEKISEIKGYEFGRDLVGSERSYDFALVSAFEDMAAMQRYQTHPDHMVVLEIVKDICQAIRAVDFEV